MRSNKKRTIILLLLVLCITIGYAVLSSSLNIIGNSFIKRTVWDIHFDNIQVQSGSVDVDTEHGEKEATIDTPTEVSYNIKLNKPGDYYEFLVDVVNEGTLDAEIETISSIIEIGEEEQDLDKLPKWLKYNIEYEDGDQIEQNHILGSEEVETYRVRVEFNKDVNNDELPEEEQVINLKLETIYVQGKEEDKSKYTVYFNGNGGLGSTSPKECQKEEDCILNANRFVKENYNFIGWSKKKNGEVEYTNQDTVNNLTTRNSITLYAVWDECSGDDCVKPADAHTIHFDYDGGEEGETTRVVYEGEKIGELPEPEKDNKIFEGWYDNETLVTKDTIVTGDMTLKAKWVDIVAKIGTRKYASIMSAHAEAVSGDTIELLKDTEEVVTNSKNVTLDLGGYTVEGSITNTAEGDLTLLNGTIENTEGTAVINDGTLTLGVNDHDDDGQVVIDDNYVAIKGSTTGLKQNNVLNYYDGYIEGEVALDGGYDDSPVYRNTFDGVVVYYFPFVEHDNLKDVQHATLDSSDNAITKTSVHGDIYYYNLQDNINTSARTGYTIYAVRDFTASYALTVPENSEINFDISGYNVTLAGNTTNDGTLNLENSLATGNITTSTTITNNNVLDINDVIINKTNDGNLINNNKDLSISNSILESKNGYTVYNRDNNITFSMDSNTTLKSSSYTLFNPANNTMSLTSGTVGGINNSGTLYLSDTIKVTSSSSYINNSSGGRVEINGGEITTNGQYTIYNNGGNIVINGGTIILNRSSSSNGAYVITGTGTTTMNGGLVQLRNQGRSAVYLPSGAKLIQNAGEIKSSQNGIYGYGGNFEMNNGKLTASGTAIDYSSGGSVKITDGEVTGQKGMRISTYDGSRVTITGGTIKGTGDSGIILTNYAYGSAGPTASITGGTIIGKTYGLRVTSSTATIGTDDNDISVISPEIIGETYGLYVEQGNVAVKVNFYDGILKGKTNSYSGSIALIPETAEINSEIIDGYTTSYLVEASNFLRVGNQEYNTFTAAYNAIEEEGTIYLLKTISKSSKIPTIESSKDITFDLDGNTLTISNIITNKGNLTIVDNSTSKTGTLISNVSKSHIISNSGTFKLESGAINSPTSYINNSSSGRVEINGGEITTREQYTLYNNGGNIVINDGTIILNRSSSSNGAYVIAGTGTTTMNGGLVELKSQGRSAVYLPSSAKLIQNAGEIKSSQYGIYGYGGSFEMNNGKLTASGTAIDYSSGGSVKITDGEVTGKNGITFSTYEGSKVTITGGTIKGTGETGITISNYAYGSAGPTVSITGGKIIGKTYGLRLNAGTTTLGTDDENIGTTSPEITGDTYGLYVNQNEVAVKINFYDGILKGKTNSYSGSITLIPETAEINSEVVDEYTVSYLIEASNFLRVGNQEYNTFTDAYNAIEEEGTIYLLKTISRSSKIPTIESDKDITFDLDGNTLTISNTITNKGNLTIVDGSMNNTGALVSNVSKSYIVSNSGTFKLESGSISSPTSYINNSSSGRVEINGGKLTTNWQYTLYNNGGNIVINDGTVTLNTTFTEYGAYVVYGTGTTTMNGGLVELKNQGRSAVYLVSGAKLIQNAGEIKSTTDAIYGTGGSLEVNGGKITSNENGIDFLSGGSVKITGGEITGADDGVQFSTYEGNKLTITGGTIKGIRNTGVLINSYYDGSTGPTLSITGGTIIGKTYGVDVEEGNITIGADDGDINIISPELIGETYGLYTGSHTSVITTNFYDGVLKGKTNSYSGIIDTIATDASIVDDTEEIDSETYYTSYLVNQNSFILNGDKEYKKLSTAIEEASPGDTLEFIDNGQLYDALTISNDKDVTLDLNGYSLTTNRAIVNNGKLKIINNGNQESSITSRLSTYMITNNNNATLEIDNIELNSPYVIKNNSGGTFDGNDTIITSNSIAINNQGTMNIDNYNISGNTYGVYLSTTADNSISNSTITSGNYAVYKNSTSTTTIDGTDIFGNIYNGNSNGVININDSTISKSIVVDEVSAIINQGQMKYSNSSIYFGINNKYYSDSYDLNAYAINNNGSLTIENNSVVNVVFDRNSRFSNYHIYGIYNKNSTVFKDSDLIIVGNNATNHSTYGIYNSTGTTQIVSGNVDANGGMAYGVYVAGGTVILGVPEPTTSPDYGKDTADVSITNPFIKATGSNNYAIYNRNGTFKYFDGKILGSPNYYNEAPNEVEYLYETKEYTDENNKYVILEWMRQQP